MQQKKSIKVFLASSNELEKDRDAFALMIERKNKLWALTDRPYINLQTWEICSESVSATRTQDEYNAIIRTIDIVVVLVWTKLGKYTSEEFQLAKKLFIQKGKPSVIVYQKKSDNIEESVTEYLSQFSETGKEYFHGQYDTFSELENKFLNELDLYLNKNRVSKLTEKDKNRIELLEGLERRYEKRILSKMDSELNFQLELILEYTKAGTSDEHIQDYFVEDYDTKSWEGFNELFYEFETKLKRLLILGEPGAGKTVLLLQFAKRLIEKAKINFDYPLPIILNLATWRNESQDFKTWLEDNLVYAAGEYGTAKKYAKELVVENNMLLLLDGLDEIPEADRDSCLEKLQDYIIQNERTKANIADYPQLIICSRKNEYVQLPKNAPVKASLYISPLKANDLIEKLEQWKTDNSSAKVLLNRIKANPKVANELSTSFDVHLALHLANEYDFKDFSKEDLLETFIKTELKKIEGTKPDKSKSYLGFLANKLNQSKKGVTFELTDIQPNWLSKLFLFNLILNILSSFCLSTIYYSSIMSFPILVYEKPFSLIFDNFLVKIWGMIFIILIIYKFVYSDAKEIKSEEILKLNFSKLNFSKYKILGNVLFKSILKEYIIGFILSFVFLLLMFFYSKDIFEAKLIIGFFVLPFVGGLIYITSLGVYKSLMDLIVFIFFSVKRNQQINNPYKRLTSSFWMKVKKYLIIFNLILAPLTINSFLKSFNETANLKSQDINDINYIAAKVIIIILFFLFFTFFSIITSFFNSSLYKHLVLRFLLFIERKTALRYRTFLNKVAKTGLMEKDGGQWRFRHQLIQDWFARQDSK